MALPRTSTIHSCREETVETIDRRLLPRMKLDVPVSCEVEGERIEALARSISGNGMLIEASAPIPTGSILHVSIGPPLSSNTPFEARLLVTRVEEARGVEGRHRVAGRFEEVF